MEENAVPVVVVKPTCPKRRPWNSTSGAEVPGVRPALSGTRLLENFFRPAFSSSCTVSHATSSQQRRVAQNRQVPRRG